jgi:hypothetical protein
MASLSSLVCLWQRYEPTLEWNYTLTHKHYTLPERLVRDKIYSLLLTLVNYSRKKFCKIGLLSHCCETFYVYNLQVLVIS